MFEQNNNNTTPEQPEDYNSYYNNPSENGTANYVNYYSNPEDSGKKNRKGGKKVLKVVSFLAALAIVSVSSIELYKVFGQNNMRNWTSVADSSYDDESEAEEIDGESETSSGSEDEDSEKETSAAGAYTSWVTMASAEDALTIPEIVEKAMPSVVGISADFEYEDNTSSYWGWGGGYYGNNGGSQTQVMTGTGTGIIMSEDGYIITNAHCIYDTESDYQCGKAVSVSVVMGDEDETEYDAQIVGYDLETDLAVLKIDAKGLTPAEFGDSDALQVGELVVAIGNPLGFELFGTTTCGIVSALNREVTINEKDMTLIQTDAAINSGNSGGPLLNCYGQVIGINSAKMSSTYGSATVEGLGFAIPISDAQDIINDLINYGYVAGRPQLGITGVNVTESDSERYSMPQGVYVYSVTEDSAAYEAGIRQGDIITSIAGQEITTMDELNEVKNEYNAGDTITIGLYRSGETLEVRLTLQEVTQED
jgi:serine protease Do